MFKILDFSFNANTVILGLLGLHMLMFVMMSSVKVIIKAFVLVDLQIESIDLARC